MEERARQPGELKRELEVLRARVRKLEGAEAARRIAELGRERAEREVTLRQTELEALLKGARAILRHQVFDESARAIFDRCKEAVGASAGYVALLSPSGAENEVLFLDAGGAPCTVDPDLPMPIRGLRSESYRLARAVYDNDFSNSEWMSFMPEGHVELRNVMFAPLVLEGKAVGLLGLANKAGDFDERDARMAAAFGELAAIALLNSRSVEQRDRAEQEQQRLIQELQEALAHVKTLSGLLPICSCCKKIRDEQGSWHHVESYIQTRSEAEFSHSICPQCLEEQYPQFASKARKPKE